MTSDLFKGGSQSSTGGYVKCHASHKPIQLGMGEILGGSCGQPRAGFDVYIGFCGSMKFSHTAYPWDLNKYENPPIEFQYLITDMCAPKSPEEFRKMVEWVSEQLEFEKRIHVGCIGGHGRTGTFLAALVSLYEDLTDDPIKWVRENHCKKAVESETQIKFLMKHFGCKTAKPTKQHSAESWDSGKGYQADWNSQPRSSGYRKPSGGKVVSINQKIAHVSRKGSIWG